MPSAKGHDCIMMYRAAAAVNASGELFAVRCGRHKVYWRTRLLTKEQTEMRRRAAVPFKPGKQDPPLMFDLVADPGENLPLDSSTDAYKAALKTIGAAREAHLGRLRRCPIRMAAALMCASPSVARPTRRRRCPPRELHADARELEACAGVRVGHVPRGEPIVCSAAHRVRAGSTAACNGNGVCDAHGMACVCDSGFEGAACEKHRAWDVELVRRRRALRADVSTWGANVLDDSGGYHMYGTLISEGCRLIESGGGWLTNSVVVATAARPEGPFTPQGLALKVGKSASWWDALTKPQPGAGARDAGTYLIFYMGANHKGNTSAWCGGVAEPPPTPGSTIGCSQHVGLAYASSPDGPWTRMAEPIIASPTPPSWYELQSNPSAAIDPTDGSVLLLFKGRSSLNASLMSTGVATAPHWRGPYTVSPDGPIPVPGHCEDAGVYRSPSSGIYRALFHCGCEYQLVWSADGRKWYPTAPPVGARTWRGAAAAARRRSSGASARSGSSAMTATRRTSSTACRIAAPDPVHDGRSWTLVTALAACTAAAPPAGGTCHFSYAPQHSLHVDRPLRRARPHTRRLVRQCRRLRRHVLGRRVRERNGGGGAVVHARVLYDGDGERRSTAA